MTSNVVTLIGKAPRQLPHFAITDTDERASYYALSNADEAMRIIMTVAIGEGPKCALDLIDNIRAHIMNSFPQR